METLLKKLDLLTIGDYTFESSLSGGKALATLLYKKLGESFVIKLLIAPRNEFEFIRFKQESDALSEMKKKLLFFL